MVNGASRRVEETSRRGEETSCSGEVVWPVGLHIEVEWCDLEEQFYLPERRCGACIRSGVHPVEADDVWCALCRLGGPSVEDR